MRARVLGLIATAALAATTASCNLVLGLNDYFNECGGPLGAPTTCGTGGGGGASSSTGGTHCDTASDCKTDSACVTASCDASHACVTADAPVGTKCSDHDGAVCDGLGKCVECNEKVDCSAPGTGCLEVSACSNHTCKTSNAAEGAACDDHGGHVCDAQGRCFGVARVATGSGHTCALTTLGGVKCWGFNNHGQLGDGTTVESHHPVDVEGLDQGVLDLVVGGNHACGLTASGLKCWGSNDYGQLGDGTTMDRYVPVDGPVIASGTSWMGFGADHSCVVTTSGKVKCWGYNLGGELGDGTTTNRSSPVDTQGVFINPIAVAAGADHACSLAANGYVECWGTNGQGQLGDGTPSAAHTAAVQVHFLSNAAKIGEGYSHSCAVTATGAAKCWGVNQNGQLGDGTSTNRSTPVDVMGLSAGVDTVVGGAESTCALMLDGTLKCWGANYEGQLGDGTATSRLSADDVMGIAGAGQLSLLAYHACAVVSKGRVKCWGQNKYGQLGDDTVVQRDAPVDVLGL